MKKLLLAFTALLFIAQSHATHLMGGQVTARQLSGLTYELTLTVYRDSVGIPIANNMIINITDLLTNTMVTTNVGHNGAVNFLNGVEQYTYIDTVTFASTGAFKIEWTNCCRNGAIINMATPLAESFNLRNLLLVDTIAGNSSPVFLNPPVVLAQKNSAFVYNPLPFDADGDSLVWSIDTPLTSQGNYVNGYTLPSSDPLGLFSMDAVTGEVTWTPDSNGHWESSFIIEEFRNGAKIGEIRRDMQYIVVDDTTNWQRAAFVTSNWPTNAQGYFSFNAQKNVPTVITVMATDAGGDQLMISANGEPLKLGNNPAQFTTTWGNGSVSSLFTWTPSPANVRTAPYIVSFRVFEFHNGYAFARDQSILITVSNSTGVTELPAPYTIGSLYPSPSSGSFYIPVTLKQAASLKLVVTNALGQQVQMLDQGTLVAGQNIVFVPNMKLRNGIYFVSIMLDNKTVKTDKLVIE